MKGLAAVLLLVGVLPAQHPELVTALASADPLEREIARRHLALTETFPTPAVTKLLGNKDPRIVAIAARLLRDRGLELAQLRKLGLSDDEVVRRVVLPVASDETVRQTLQEAESVDLRCLAMFVLEDRGKLSDDLLLAAATSPAKALADAAARLLVFERSPFPLKLVDRLLKAPAARTRLISWLAERPRVRSGPWLVRVLNTVPLTPRERLLAIESLPPDWIDRKLARVVIGFATEHAVAVARTAERFPPKLADALVPDVVAAATGRKSAHDILNCLDRVSAAGEKALFEQALQGDTTLRHEVAHWLTMRESKLVPRFIAATFDSGKPFPPELVSLSAPVLTTPARIAEVVRILQEVPGYAVPAFTALIDAGVYHPALVDYAADEENSDSARSYWRILRLPLGKLPEKLFAGLLRGDDASVSVHAVNSLARAPLSKTLERVVLELALESRLPLLKAAASRAILLQGSEASARRVWAQQKSNDLALRWLLAAPKPWSHDLLLAQRASMTEAKAAHTASYHRVLIALAGLRDRGAREELITEIPFIRPMEMRRVQDLLGRFCAQPELLRLAKKYLVVRELKDGAELKIDHTEADEGRAELLEWFIRRPGLDLEELLTRLWEADESYEVRLIALRGLLARNSQKLHATLLAKLAKPFGDEQQELAFEVVGSMAHPLTSNELELLAEILLRAPLRDPRREIRFCIEQGYDSVRGAYPLLTPAANLLRRDAKVRPGQAFAAVAAKIGAARYALNRQRLGLLLAGISMREELVADLGPVLAKLILAAPDTSEEFVGPAQMILADAAESAGDYASAARRYDLASRAFCRGIVPHQMSRAFFGTKYARGGYHPYAALAAQASICRARVQLGAGDIPAAKRELARALDLAEGDANTIGEITTLRRELQK